MKQEMQFETEEQQWDSFMRSVLEEGVPYDENEHEIQLIAGATLMGDKGVLHFCPAVVELKGELRETHSNEFIKDLVDDPLKVVLDELSNTDLVESVDETDYGFLKLTAKICLNGTATLSDVAIQGVVLTDQSPEENSLVATRDGFKDFLRTRNCKNEQELFAIYGAEAEYT